MQKDFHYYVIRILSEKAGFNSVESQIIAYASQYVDDATEHKPIVLPEKYDFQHTRLKDNILDPVCTAHKGIQFLNDFKTLVQMMIYMSFHFLPTEKYSKQKKYSYITTPNSPFANDLINKAKNNFLDKDNKIYNLIALGIALHTYADTWSHQNFSGRFDQKDNNIDNICLWEEGKWSKISYLNQIKNNILPEIGHAEAFSYPDFPFISWKYNKIKEKKEYVRDNLNICIEASKYIYDFWLFY